MAEFFTDRVLRAEDQLRMTVEAAEACVGSELIAVPAWAEVYERCEEIERLVAILKSQALAENAGKGYSTKAFFDGVRWLRDEVNQRDKQGTRARRVSNNGDSLNG